MIENTVRYFSKHHLLANFILIAVIIGGVFSWTKTNKEELPAVTFDFVSISVIYPGAPAEDVEYFVTKPIEEELRGVDGIYRITSNSSVSQSNITVEIEQDYPDINEALIEIRNAVLDVDLPQEVITDPQVRIFKTTKKAILDIALYHKDAPILDVNSRRELQRYAFALENQLINLSAVNSVTKKNYLQEEIQVKVYPEKLIRYEIPFNTVMREISDNHVRKPAGTLETAKEPKVTVLSELNTPDKLKKLVVQSSFEGKAILLEEVAEIETGYEKNEEILKVNGHEAIMFNVVKNSSTGILEALDAVYPVVRKFKENSLKETPIELTFLDDESVDVRNRLNLVGINGAIGFVLVLITLFAFLNIGAGFWVALGIPFTLCFTMIICSLMGMTINGTTLSAVIIVMGIVVDDAIVVAENITRLRYQGIKLDDAVIQGTLFVLLPIVASIITTCVAFLPFYFFEGRFASFIEFIPPVIFLMLGASIIESTLILPGHMSLSLPWKEKKEEFVKPKSHWFDKVESVYASFLKLILKGKLLIFVIFIGLLISSWFIVTEDMKFVIFPNEETRDIVLTGETTPGDSRYETAKKVEEIEKFIIPYIGKEVVGFRTEIARSRRGGAVEENNFRTIVEIVDKEKREKSADEIVSELEDKFKTLTGFSKLNFRKTRWMHSSGSPIELIVKENNNERRLSIVREIVDEMKQMAALKNVEVDEGYEVLEYKIDINQEKIKRLSISPLDIVSTFRAALEGTVLYEFSNGDEDINVRLTTVDNAKSDIERVLDLPVENRTDYLVSLRNVVNVRQVNSPSAIYRRDLKRSTIIDADMNEDIQMTPLEIAEELEVKVFPKILSQFPTTNILFDGEIKDTRESEKDLRNALIMVLFLIYFVLAVLFNSLLKPLVIMLAIPFGLVGVIYAFHLHGKDLYGFYACVGTLGLAGVVINDAIIMLVKLDKEFDFNLPKSEMNQQIATIASTRLRAVVLTTLTTVAGVMPTAYGFAGYDAMLAEMMLALAWGMIFGTLITLVLIPCLYSLTKNISYFSKQSAIALCFIVVSFLPRESVAEEILPLDEFIKFATKNDTEFEEILIDKLILKYQKDLRLPARDIVLSVKQDYELFSDSDSNRSDTQISLSKLFPLQGTQTSLSYNVADARSSDFGEGFSESDVIFSITQPIAENAFGRGTRLTDKIIGIEVEVAHHQIVEAYEDYFAAIITAYINWYEAYENLEIAKSSSRENQKLLTNMKEREANQIALPIDVNKIRLQVFDKEEAVISREERYQTTLNVIRKTIRIGKSKKLKPKKPDMFSKVPVSFENTYKEFKQERRTFKILDKLEKSSTLQVDKDADDLLPSINLVLGYQVEGKEYALNEENNILFAGIQMDFPFNDQVQSAEYEIAKINLDKRKLINTNVDYRLYTDIKNLFEQIKRETKLLGIARKKINLAKSVLKDETENYTFGKVSLNDYIEAVNSLDSARFNLAFREAQLKRLLIEWQRITDGLVIQAQSQGLLGSQLE